MFNLKQPNYISLRSVITERTNPLVFWVGAGLSVAAGLPNWHQLKQNVCDRFRRNNETLERSGQKEQLANLKKIEEEQNLWVAFTRLYDLGHTTYEEAVRLALEEAARCEIPQNYRWLFQIKGNVKGIVTMNLDRLVGRAFSAEHSGLTPIEFCGNQCSGYGHVLRGSNTFILNAHGIVDDTSSWILRNEQLTWLLNDTAYCDFIHSILANHTVVFVGVRADDTAVMAHLQRLASRKTNVRGHYWVTDHTDMDTHKWAEDAGILMIRYPNVDDHKALGEMLADLAGYRPKDPDHLEPVESGASEPAQSTPLPAPDDLLKESDEEIRKKLNEHARFLLQEGNASRYKDYEQFRQQYDKCIHNCWYVNTTPPYNLLMGYKLVKNIAEGAFGRVFEATAKDGRRVAVKLLRDEVRRNPAMLQSFRRGVRAMRILSERNVEGMVGYADCSEIPAFAVMNLIEGPNLKEAVLAGYLNDWDVLLRFAIELVSVIRRAHQLPERVLHRDIRPANIMLKDYETNPEQSHIVVLDFDLSWHRGAELEVSVAQGPAMHGYLAPELTDLSMGCPTRNAAVDSFGLGMTLYFMRTKTDPMYMQHRNADLPKDVIRNIETHKSTAWQTLPKRFADLILLCTLNNQSKRCDVAQIVGELQRLYEALLNPERVRAADLLCHELAYRCCTKMSQIDQLAWDYDHQRASITMVSGVTVTLSSDEASHCVAGLMSWDSTGGTNFKNIKKYLDTRVERVLATLNKGGCKITDKPVSTATGSRFGFTVSCESLANNMAAVSACLADATTEMRMD